MKNLENWTKEFRELAGPLLRRAEPRQPNGREAPHVPGVNNVESLDPLAFDFFE